MELVQIHQRNNKTNQWRGHQHGNKVQTTHRKNLLPRNHQDRTHPRLREGTRMQNELRTTNPRTTQRIRREDKRNLQQWNATGNYCLKDIQY